MVVNGYSKRWHSVFGGGMSEFAQDGLDENGYAGVHARSAIGGFTGRFSLEPEMIVALPPELTRAIIANRGWTFPLSTGIGGTTRGGSRRSSWMTPVFRTERADSPCAMGRSPCPAPNHMDVIAHVRSALRDPSVIRDHAWSTAQIDSSDQSRS